MGFFDSLGAGFLSFFGGPSAAPTTFTGGLGQIIGNIGGQVLQSGINTLVGGSPQAALLNPLNPRGPGPRGFMGNPRVIPPTFTQFPPRQFGPQFANPNQPFAVPPRTAAALSGSSLLPSPATVPIAGVTPFGDFGGGPRVPRFPVTTNVGFAPSPAFFDFNINGQGPALGVGDCPGGTPMFRQGRCGASAQFFRVSNPTTGQDTWFRPAGKPLLWSGDLTACKRVNKVARRAKRKR